MTEADWMACADPDAMLDFLGMKRGRKSRLFAAACCRRVWHLMSPAVCQPAIETIERYADGLANDNELIAARKRSQRYGDRAYRKGNQSIEGDLAFRDSYRGQLVARAAGRKPDDLSMVLYFATMCVGSERLGYRPDYDTKTHEDWLKVQSEDEAEQAGLFRDIFGNPFRPVTIDPAWLRWNDATVPRLAQQMYDSRDFASMPILADALEEAGCTNADILEHCRGPGPHVRGCWVVDLVLGKE